VSTLSNGGNTWSTKLNRIRGLTEKDLSVVFNNLGHIIDMDFLLDTFRRLDGNKALGIDRISKEDYEFELGSNLTELLFRLRRGTYKPRASRIVKIPKADGGERLLAIACIEDKLVQLAVSRILEQIYEPSFIPESFGYRPGKSAHDAIRLLNRSLMDTSNGALIEIDIRKYFSTIPHELLLTMLKERISDRRFLWLIKVLLESSSTDGVETRENSVGVPEGSILSPLLSNVYLHRVLDSWFKEVVRERIIGKATIIRFADDAVFVFQYMCDAERFLKVLPKRLEKYGLQLHEGKTQILPAGFRRMELMRKKGERLPVFTFLGFTFYWRKTRKGNMALSVKTRKDRFREKLQEIKLLLKRKLNHPNHRQVLDQVSMIVRGWLAYFAVSDNHGSCWKFITEVTRLIFHWFNRRGSTGCMNWQKLRQVLTACNFPNEWKTIRLYNLPTPRS
jgi:RNA-directed DNA polymerase